MKKQSQRSKKKKSSKKRGSAPKKREVGSLNKELPQPVKQEPSRNVPKKAIETKEGNKGAIPTFVGKARQFLREAKMELTKVKWPTRKELIASTAVVIVLTLLVAFFLGLVDFGLIKIIKNVVR